MTGNEKQEAELESLARQLERQGMAAVGAAMDLRKRQITLKEALTKLRRACTLTKRFIASQAAVAALLLMAMSACGNVGPVAAAQLPAAEAAHAPTRCAALQPRGDGLYSDPHLDDAASGDLCKPLPTANGWRCLPASPYWDVGLIRDRGASVEIPDATGFAVPFYVLTPVEVAPFHALVSRALRIGGGAEAPGTGVFVAPYPISSLEVALATFAPCN